MRVSKVVKMKRNKNTSRERPPMDTSIEWSEFTDTWTFDCKVCYLMIQWWREREKKFTYTHTHTYTVKEANLESFLFAFFPYPLATAWWPKGSQLLPVEEEGNLKKLNLQSSCYGNDYECLHSRPVSTFLAFPVFFSFLSVVITSLFLQCTWHFCYLF